MESVKRQTEAALYGLFGMVVVFSFLSRIWPKGFAAVVAVVAGGLIYWLKSGVVAPVVEKAAPVSGDSAKKIELARTGHLAVRHVFPPRLPRRGLSFLGGKPMGPRNFEWPMAKNREGLLEWLPFVGQIDCSTLPAGEAVDLLPREGVLYFFLPMAGEVNAENQKVAVQYCPQRPGVDWEEHHGMTLPPVGGEVEAKYQFRWMNWRENAVKHYPRAYPRVEIELGWVSYGGEVAPGDADAENGFPWEVAKARYEANLEEFHGPMKEWKELLSKHRSKTEKWHVHEQFPWSWHAIEIAAGHALTTLVEKKVEGMEAVEAGLRDMLRWIPQKNEEPGAEAKAKFWELVEAVEGKRNEWLSEAAVLSAEACLNDAKEAGRMPAEVVEALRWRHDRPQHQLLGKGREIQIAAEEMAGTHLLLLELGPDEAMQWQMGDSGAYQFWITPEDLKGRKFERVVVTFECH